MFVSGLRSCFVAVLILFTQYSSGANVGRNEDISFWRNSGLMRLKKLLESEETYNINYKAKNVIIFIGDGMGINSVTAGRIYKGQQNGSTGEEEQLVFEDFPYTGLAKTYNIDKQVPDSAGTATAIFSGVKTRYGVIGMDNSSTPLDAERGRLTSIMDWAVAAGKRIGIVTTTRITHATPASTYANIYHRDWECDTEVPEESSQIYKDIARQLVEDSPGNKFNVILGGGLSPMGDKNYYEKSSVKFEGETEEICSRGDGRNLTDEWLDLEPRHGRKYVKTREQLMNLDLKNVSHLLGLFRNNHITYAIAQEPDEPLISEMVLQALRVLDKNDAKGFVLMVEGGRIDQAHHQNYARAALQEVLELDAAVEVARQLTNPRETLIIVTADHSHSMTVNGYPKRGTDILGFANKTAKEPPYETITYANGPGFWDHHILNSTSSENLFNTWIKMDTNDIARMSPTYRHLAAMPLKDETHGGEDVGVYASGPGASLIRGTFEQNYLAYVMSYAACMGPAAHLHRKCEEGWHRWGSIGSGRHSISSSSSLGLGYLLLGYVIIKLFFS